MGARGDLEVSMLRYMLYLPVMLMLKQYHEYIKKGLLIKTPRRNPLPSSDTRIKEQKITK